MKRKLANTGKHLAARLIQLIAQLVPRRGRGTPLGHPAHKAVVPLGIGLGHPVAGERPERNQGQRDRHEGEVPPHHPRELEAEELRDRLPHPPLRPVDADVGAPHQSVQIIEQVLVQADRRGHGQRADRAPVEHRQPVQLLRREARQAGLLHPLQQPLQLPPGLLPLPAELGGFQRELSLAHPSDPLTPLDVQVGIDQPRRNLRRGGVDGIDPQPPQPPEDHLAVAQQRRPRPRRG